MTTYAPATYREARAFLIEQFDMHPGSTGSADDLDPAEVGIVGSAAHIRTGTSYHLGLTDLLMWKDPYSVRLERDRRGLTDGASALDVGEFRKKLTNGRVVTHRDLAVWAVRQCQAGARDADWIREIIYSPDGKVVLRYDRQRGQTSAPRAGEADSSHLTHDHFSGYRDCESVPKRPLFERFLREMGDEDMPTAQEVANALLSTRIRAQDGTEAQVRTFIANGFMRTVSTQYAALRIEKALADHLGVDAVDEQAIAAVLAPTLAAAIREELGDLHDEQVTGAVERGLRRVLGSLDTPTEPAPAPPATGG